MITIGTRFASYQITSLLGQGGMGEVYHAVDTKLNRDVALKFLPPQFTSDPDRMERFQREAHVLASLNHSNIAGIYGLEESDGMRALVMELVAGPTLADRIAQGPLPIEDVLNVAKQMAEALEYAHERGIIHRDLKPANIKLTIDGKVKILDFGLAKAMTSDAQASSLSNSPTMSLAATQAGVILGTAAYMAPEQAKGKPVDRRADIWAFGVIVYEMLTGRSMFSAETASEIIAQVMMKEPDWNALPANTPLRLRDLLRRCLIKDPRMRLRDIGDARIAIEETMAMPQTETSPAAGTIVSKSAPLWRRALPWVLAAMLAGVSIVQLREKPSPSTQQLRFSISPPEKTTFVNPGIPKLSPDGRYLVFNVTGEGGSRLWVREMDTLEARPLNGTEGAAGAPFWSFDSRWIVFSAQGKLKKIEIAGGPAQTLCDVRTDIFGGFWTRDNRIVFGGPPGLLEVPATGGSPSPLTIPNLSRGEAGHVEPSLLPDGVHFTYTRYAPNSDIAGVYIGSLNAKPEQQGSKRLLADLSPSAYAPGIDGSSETGFLLFVREGTLMAQPFDSSRMELSGDAIPIANQLEVTLGIAPAFSVSMTGVLAYFTGIGGDRYLTWYDRQGRQIATEWSAGPYRELSISRDGGRVSVVRESGNADIYVFDLIGKRSIRLTSSSFFESQPLWSQDDKSILFRSTGNAGGFYSKSANGAGDQEPVMKFDQAPGFLTDWSSDGHFVLYTANDPKNRRDVWVLNLTGEHKSTKFLQTEFNESTAKFAPESQAFPRYVAYVSDESGRDEVYVTTFPDSRAGKWPISTGGGYQPRWRRDGKELLYFNGEGKLMSVDVTLTPSFTASTPKILFHAPINGGGATLFQDRWDLTPDGQRFLIITTTNEVSSPVAVVVNWQAGLKR
jgi:eukaryotic-like serine/threonine-protein kinase